MSSRALRRAQRELEEKKLQEQLAQNEQEDEDEDESEEASLPAAKPKPSLFAMLGDEDGADDQDDDDSEPAADVSDEATPAPKPSKKRKKKKRKGKGKAPAQSTEPESRSTPDPSLAGLDEIDRALLALNLTSNGASGPDGDQLTSAISEEKKQLYSVLSVDTQNLHAANEMRKLFGRAAVTGGGDDEPRARQRGRGQQGGIAAAVAGRNPPGRNLASLGLRRNIFIQGKEEWPRATSGGLGMEIVEKRSDGSVEYRFVHNRAYQEVQIQFETCVASMDPERMIQLLHFNPYHISTLLQVSEIAKQQRDNATASDLLERALFTFGRSVHSSFSSNLAAGKARLNFRRPENREFWLAIWRYISTLGIRATWRTAFEWAKLLLSMAPEEDPYCLRLLVDQLALRGREPQALIDLVEADHLQRIWKVPPNLAFSVALAHDRLKEPQKARSTLKNAIKQYPWLAARLCKELDISPIPKPVWGKEPHDDHQELLCQLYVPKAKDLWKTTQGTSLLVEVCYSVEEDLGAGENPYWLANIPELDIARHVVLSDDRSLLTLLDPRIKSKYTSVSDPLPPDDNLTEYIITEVRNQGRRYSGYTEEQLFTELDQVRDYFERLNIEQHVNAEGGLTQDGLTRALEEAHSDLDEFRRNTERAQLIRVELQRLGVEVVVETREEREARVVREDESESD